MTTVADGGGERPPAKIERNDANSDTKITVGSKNFTEQKVLGEIYAQGLEAAGFTVDKELNLGDEKIALKAREERRDRRLPGVHGHGAALVLRREGGRDPEGSRRPRSRTRRPGFAEEGLVAYPPTPFTSSNEVGLTKEKAEELGVTTISDLAEHDQDLTLYGSPECRQRTDCLLGLAAGLRARLQEVRARRDRPAPRGADERQGRPVDRVHDRSADPARGVRAARGRQGHVPAVQLDVRRPPGDRGRGGRRAARRWSRRSRRA